MQINANLSPAQIRTLAQHAFNQYSKDKHLIDLDSGVHVGDYVHFEKYDRPGQVNFLKSCRLEGAAYQFDRRKFDHDERIEFITEALDEMVEGFNNSLHSNSSDWDDAFFYNAWHDGTYGMWFNLKR